MEKCIACGECAAKCLKKIDSECDAATGKCKAIHVKCAQVAPSKCQIDADSCICFKKAGAYSFCEKVCSADAINFDDTEKMHNLQAAIMKASPDHAATAFLTCRSK